MNRRHTGNEAFISIENSINAGFSNITVDLIYGMPSMTIDKVKSNIDSILKYKVNHISTYCLTVEPNTAFNHFVKQKKFHYLMMMRHLHNIVLLLNI
jgi:oxygen-independent coproporphyrinogen III oxidase